MKKIISLALATAMVFTMSAVAFAAGSVTDAVVESTTSTEGVTGTVTASNSISEAAAVEGTTAEDAVTDNTDYDSYTAYVFELTLSAGGTMNDATVIVTVAGVEKGNTITVLHYYDSKWNKVDGAYVNDDGDVVIPGLNDLSPFMVIVDTTVSTSSSSSSSSASIFTDAYGYWNAAGEFVWYGYFEDGVFIYTMDPAAVNATVASAASPKTGEGVVVAVAMSVILVAGVAGYGLLRKKEEN